MEPLTMILIAAGGLAALLVTCALWDRIVALMLDIVFPWMERHLPTVAPHLREVFVRLDTAVSTLRRGLKQLYRNVREHLLASTTTFERQGSVVKQRTESYTRDMEGGFQRHSHVESVSFDDLPSDVRAQLMRSDAPQKVNIIAQYDEYYAQVH